MTIDMIKLNETMAAVRYLLHDLGIDGVKEEDYLYLLLFTYAVKCEEKLEGYFEPDTGSVVLEVNKRAQKAFANSVKKFLEKINKPTIRESGERRPSYIAELFGRFFEQGNFPEDSPYALRKKILERVSILKHFLSLEDNFNKFFPEEKINFQIVRNELEKIEREASAGLFEDDELATLSKILSLLESGDVTKRKIGMGLIVFFAIIKDALSFMPAFLINMAEISLFFEPQSWSSHLAQSFRNTVINMPIHDSELFYDILIPAEDSFDSPNGVYKSILVLLSKSEIELAKIFIRQLVNWNALTKREEALLHIAASIEMNNVRRKLINRAWQVYESRDYNGYFERPLADHIAMMLSYLEYYEELEANLLRLIDKLVYQRILDTGFHDEEDDDFIINFMRAVFDLYNSLMNKGIMPDERKKYIIDSIQARAIELAANQNLNPIRRFLLSRAIENAKKGENEKGWQYLEPLMLIEEQARLDDAEKSPYEYWMDFLKRKRKANKMGGGASEPGTPIAPSGLNDSGKGVLMEMTAFASSNYRLFNLGPTVFHLEKFSIANTGNLMLLGGGAAL